MHQATSDRRYYEDLVVGEVVPFTPVTVTRDMIVSYAREFDPFPFHLDEKAARRSLLGGLASSGWQTAALSMRMLVDAFLGNVAGMGGLGFSDLRWKRPVMVDDTIGGTATIFDVRRSRSRPDRGIVTIDFDIRNQRNEPVMSMRLANLVAVRDPERDGSMATPPLPYDVPVRDEPA